MINCFVELNFEKKCVNFNELDDSIQKISCNQPYYQEDQL